MYQLLRREYWGKASAEFAAEFTILSAEWKIVIMPTKESHTHSGPAHYKVEVQLLITTLTVFLASGKTTLLNNILQDKAHGMKFAIIKNEYGDIDIDSDLVTMKEDSNIKVG